MTVHGCGRGVGGSCWKSSPTPYTPFLSNIITPSLEACAIPAPPPPPPATPAPPLPAPAASA
eukprot:4896556-Prymnesium_polylepis.2